VFGDWHVFRILLTHGWRVGKAIRGENRSLADQMFYDFKG